MRKAFLVFISLLLLINTIYAFDVTDSTNKERVYFSTSNSLVKVSTTSLDANFSVTYTNGNSSTVEVYNFTDKKGEFSIVNFFSKNSFVLVNTNLSIKVGSESKTIYLDIEKPDFSFLSSNIDSDNLEVDLVFSYTDNYKIDKVLLYKKTGSDLTYITNFSSENTYSYKFEKSGDLELEFQVYDKAGNTQNFQKTITIPDITKPKISISKLILEDGKYSLSFIVTDENLSKYEITQGTLKLTNEISGTSSTQTVNLPYESGEVIFNVYDKAGNFISKTLTLKSPFENKYESKFSNEKDFSFISNANTCELISVDSQSVSEKFDKDSDEYSFELEIDKNKNYEIEFYCENSNFKEFFKRDFYYDTNNPENTKLNIEVSEDGSLKLSWEEATDSQSEVEYILYRDDEDIYSGSKLRYTDDEVIYTKTYEYYLEVVDEAGNFVESNKVSGTPKKVDITLLTNLLKQQEIETDTFNLKLNTDTNSKVTVIIKNNLKEIFRKDYETKNNQIINEALKLDKGVNEVIVKITDEFSNNIEESYFITYSSPVLSQSTNNQPVVETVSQPVVVPTITNEVQKEEEVPKEVSTFSFWMWFIFWVIVIGICLYVIFFKRDVLHQIVSIKKKRNSNGFAFSRRKDIVLGKNLDNIKRARINRQREREIEKLRLKKEEESRLKRSKIVSQKHKDLSQPRLTPISFNSREKSKKSFKRINKNNQLRNQILSSKSKGRDLISSIKNTFKFEKKKSGVQKEDPLSEYLSRSTKKKSYETSSDYHFKEQKIVTSKPKEEKVTEKKEEEPVKPKEPEKFSKLSLDDYLSKRTKKKRFFFAEKAVEKDLDKRERN